MKTITFPNGDQVPAVGLGTWYMGDRPSERGREVEALRAGLDAGMTLIDTAEMYADGGAEEVVGEAIQGRRDGCYLVSKVLPSNASQSGTVEACEDSLRRLKTDYLDLYLLHWPGPYGLEETIAGFNRLVDDGKIKVWGVSNFDAPDMAAVWNCVDGNACQTNQVLYNLSRRGIEYDLIPALAARSVPVMAYSPLEQGRILANPAIAAVAARHDASPAQIAIAWLLARDNIIPIPKSSDLAHVAENRAAAEIDLTVEDIAELDDGFPAPTSKRPLAIL